MWSPFLLPQLLLSGTQYIGSRVADYEGWLIPQVLLTSWLFGVSSVVDAFWWVFGCNTKICILHTPSHVHTHVSTPDLLVPNPLFLSRPPTRQPGYWHCQGIRIFSPQATSVSTQGGWTGALLEALPIEISSLPLSCKVALCVSVMQLLLPILDMYQCTDLIYLETKFRPFLPPLAGHAEPPIWPPFLPYGRNCEPRGCWKIRRLCYLLTQLTCVPLALLGHHPGCTYHFYLTMDYCWASLILFLFRPYRPHLIMGGAYEQVATWSPGISIFSPTRAQECAKAWLLNGI